MKLTLLTRDGCHLCDQMLEAVRPLAAARGATVAVVDIDGDPALLSAYGKLIPVLFAGEPVSGAELCRYRIDRARVDAALSGSGGVRD
jgi:hypothetical protein